MFYLYVNIFFIKITVCRNSFPLKTVNVAYFQRKVQLSGLSAYPSQLIRISGILLYYFLFSLGATMMCLFIYIIYIYIYIYIY
jgi:hypothetical protein